MPRNFNKYNFLIKIIYETKIRSTRNDFKNTTRKKLLKVFRINNYKIIKSI